MLQQLLQNKKKVAQVSFLVLLLILIRAFENTLFYDPFLNYFKSEYANLPFPEIRRIPVWIANYMGKTSVQNRIVGFAYILLTFFIIPFLLIYFSRD